MQDKLPIPQNVTPEQLRNLFEKRGYTTVSDRQISIDVYDILAQILPTLQYVQLWGDMLKAANKKTGIEHTADFIGISAHSGRAGQTMNVIPFKSLDDALNLPRASRDALHKYGADTTLRAERLDDTDMVEMENQNLDVIGEVVLGIWNLLLPEPPVVARNAGLGC